MPSENLLGEQAAALLLLVNSPTLQFAAPERVCVGYKCYTVCLRRFIIASNSDMMSLPGADGQFTHSDKRADK